MSHVIGIDLGTTNSCVAIPESAEIPRKEELLAARRLVPAGGALVITDGLKARTTASAVWVDHNGTVVVGSRAKQMARRDDVPPPALFFKRAMGTDQEVTAGYRTMTPEEASAHVLAHMKGIAEEVLGEPVHRAIVTVPAFFETKAKNLTTEAGERAGLEVVETLLEPVAAALMYTRTRELVDPMTFMVYDLGGGTFDNSIVTWDPDTGFENRSFDGNQFLGGYDFDWRIVKWMISQPDLDHYDLNLDRSDPKDHAILYQLLSIAERANHDLSRDLEVQIADTTISDRAGELMNINLYLSRDTFEHMIEEETRGTLASCDRALAKANVRAEDLSEIVMVGGSSRIPFVRQLVAEKYQREPIVIDPDLCVAVGAALKAATVATRSSYLTLERPPATVALASIDVSGRVLCGDDIPSAAGVTVQLGSDEGRFRRQEATNADGGFLFEDVALREEAENGFTVQVLVGGKPVDTQKLVVTHSWDAGARDVIPEGDILAHDFSIAVHDGLHLIAKAGTKLPYRASTVNLETATQRGEVRVEFYEENSPVGRVIVPDLPRDLPKGSAVLVDLEFSKGWTVSASAKIPAGTEATAYAEIQLPKTPVPSWSELRQRCRQAEANLQEMEGAAPPAELLRVGKAIDDKLREVQQLTEDQHDPIHAHHALSEAETLLRSIRTSEAEALLHPPLSEFEAAIEKLDGLVRRLEAKDPALGAQHRAGVESLRATGLAAHDAGNPIDWGTANENVRRQIEKAEKDLGTEPQGDHWPASIVQISIAQELGEIIDRVNDASRAAAGRFAAEFDELRTAAVAIMDEVTSVEVSDEQAASSRLSRIYHTSILPLRARFDQLIDKAFGKQETGPGADLRLPRSSMA